MDKEDFEMLQSQWRAVENQKQVPKEFKGTVSIRHELINPASILEFLSLTASRLAFTEKRGSLCMEFAWLLQRSLPTDQTGIRRITVVSVRKLGEPEQMLRRCSTGVNALPLVMAEEVRKALDHELLAGIPRSRMGRSAFAFGTLVKLVTRRGLKGVDLDGVRAHLQMRLRALPESVRCTLTGAVADYLADVPGMVARLQEGNDDSADDIKERMTALSNLMHIDLKGDELQLAFYDKFRTDCIIIMRHFVQMNPALRRLKKDEAHPDISTLAATDHDREQCAIQSIDQRDCSNEHDGCFFFVPPHIDLKLFIEQKLHDAGRFKMKVKEPMDVIELARRKFPTLDWTLVNPVPAKEYLHSFRTIMECKDAVRIRAKDSHVTNILRGRMELEVIKSGKDSFEIFRDGQWKVDQSSDDYEDHVLWAMREAFGHFTYDDVLDQTVVEVREPFENNAFAGAIAKSLLKRMRSHNDCPLDSRNFYLLLDNRGMVLDFKQGAIRKATASDRLHKHIPFELKTFAHQTELLDFSKALCSTFRALSPGSETGAGSMDDRRGEFGALIATGHFPMLDAPHGVFEDFEWTIYVLRVLCCIDIGIPEIVHLFAYTGPQNCAKSFLALLVVGVLGQNADNLASTLPSNWLCTPMREDAESSTPVAAALCGAKLVVPKEQLKKMMLPEKVKTLVAGPDVNMAARHNFSKKGEQTSFPITWKVLVQSNSELRYSMDPEDGLAGKIVEVRPPFEFVPKELHDPNNMRQRVAKPDLSVKALKGEFGQELVAWAIALAPSFATDICGGRVLSPQPRDLVTEAIEAAEGQRVATSSLIDLIAEKCDYVDDPSHEALECNKLKAMFPGHDSSEWTAAGFGAKFRGQVRRKKEGLNFDYFLTKLPGKTVAGAIGLKKAAPKGAPASSSVS